MMQLSGVRLIELCYYNSATMYHTMNGLASSHATIATLLSGLKPCHKDSIKQHTNNCLKVIFIIVESPVTTCTVLLFLRGKFELSIVDPPDLVHL